MKKTIRDYDLNNKKVLIRVDFNVPMKDGKITDDTRVKASLPTIKYALDNDAKVILLSHLGRVKEESDKKKLSLKPVFELLSSLLEEKVYFVEETRGKKLEEAISKLNNKEVLVIENTRFEDYPNKLESTNNLELGKYWASLGDIFINDAFGTCHRAHASNVGIASNLPSGLGFLVEKEIKAFEPVLNNPKKPFTVILGGAKVVDKIPVIENLIDKADHILIGGGMAYTFLKAQNYEIGKSLVDLEHIEFCQNLLNKYPNKIILPVDSVNALEIAENAITHDKNVEDFMEEEIGLDIGTNTISEFKKYLEKSKTIVWNGPMGYAEYEVFSKGTKAICETLKKVQATKIIGGGDTISLVQKLGYNDENTHISTGGGASLELLSGKILPGIDAIDEKNIEK